MTTSPDRRQPVSLTLVFALIAAAVIVGWRYHQEHGNSPLQKVLLDDPLKLKPFQLSDNRNFPFNLDRLSGKWTLMFFGYTSCPDVCPTTLSEMTRLNEIIRNSDAFPDVQIVFVSIDPDRDSIEHLDNYIAYFNKEFIAATGTVEQLNVLTDQVGIRHRRLKQQGEDYLVEHGADILLIDPVNSLVARFEAPHYADEIANTFKALLNQHLIQHKEPT